MEFGQRMKCCLSSAMATGAMFFASAAQATDWLVDQVNGNDGNLGAGVWTQAFATIQKAIDEASSGDSIFVAEGVYTPYEATPGDPLSTFVIDSGV